jgi:hypothetical protein
VITLGKLRELLAPYSDDELVFVDHEEADSIGLRNSIGGEDLITIGNKEIPDEEE